MLAPRVLRFLLAVVFATSGIAGLSGCAGSHEAAGTRSRLDPSRVPEGLRELVPLAERWGVGDDVERTEKLGRATPGELEELRAAVGRNGAAITAWLDSYGSGAEMSEEAAAFMYMQLAVEEIP